MPALKAMYWRIWPDSARVVNYFPRLTAAVEEAQESIPGDWGVFKSDGRKGEDRSPMAMPEDNPILYIYAAHHLRKEEAKFNSSLLHLPLRQKSRENAIDWCSRSP